MIVIQTPSIILNLTKPKYNRLTNKSQNFCKTYSPVTWVCTDGWHM
jgi:hypothetical protein